MERIGKLYFKDKKEAESTLLKLREILKVYSTVSVSDLYGLLKMEGGPESAHMGWTDLSKAQVVKGVDGNWKLKLPTPKKLYF